MAGDEIWNFVNKFHNLRNAGKNATLTLKSQDGKVVMNLQLDLHVADLPPPQPPRQHRPSPSRVRRTERRANARIEAAAAANAALLAFSAENTPPTKETAVHAVPSTKETFDVAVQAAIVPIAHEKTTDDAAVQVVLPPVIHASPDDHHHHEQLRADHAHHYHIQDQLQKLYEEVDKAHKDFDEMKKLKNEEIQILKDQLESLPALILRQLQSHLQPNR